MRFKKFYEQRIQADTEKSDHVQKVKGNIMDYIHTISTWIQEESRGAKLKDIQNKAGRFKRFLEDENESIEKIISDKKTLMEYNKLYNNLISILAEFKNPNEDLNEKILGIKDIVAQFNSFIQSQISVPR